VASPDEVFNLRSPEPLGPEDWVAAAQAAETQFAAFAHYGPRNPAKQFTGRLGERAAARWLERHLKAQAPERCENGGDLLVQKTFDDAARLGAKGPGCDLRVGVVGIEVKTYRNRSWKNFGISVSATQLERIQEHSRAILFWLIPDRPRDENPDEPNGAQFLGWISTGAVAAKGVPHIDGDGLRQIKLPARSLSNPGELIEGLCHGNLATWRRIESVVCRACGSQTQQGICWRCQEARQDRRSD